MTRDLRTLIYLLNLVKNVREHCHWAQGMGWNPVCSRGAAVEADTLIGRAAVEADAIGEQQSKRTRSGAAADRESGERRAACVSKIIVEITAFCHTDELDEF